MRVMISGVMVVVALVSGVGAQEAARAGSAKLAALHELLALDRTQAWRTDAWEEGGELVARITPASPEAELTRVRPRSGPGAVARARYDAAGRLEQLTIRDARKTGAQVSRTATATERAAALRTARFGSTGKTELLLAARSLRWTLLGAEPQVGDATLTWQPSDGARERAVWHVPVTVKRDGSDTVFVMSLDPMDGSLLELTRKIGR